MKYCAFYYRDLKEQFPLFDEFKINYRPNEKKLFEFLDFMAEKRIIIRLTEEDIADLVLSHRIDMYIERENKNFAFVLPSVNEDSNKSLLLFLEKLKQGNIQYFFNDKIYSIDKVWELINLGVSDVYICGELGFELQQISNKIHKAGVNIRVFPDIAQSTAVAAEPIKQFFIRPEDIAIYEDYVDICEFYEEDFEGRIEILYSAYCEQKGWSASLNNIIAGVDIDVPSVGITKHFGKMRSHCAKRCLKDSSCNMCITAINFADTVTENGFKLTPVNKTDN